MKKLLIFLFSIVLLSSTISDEILLIESKLYPKIISIVGDNEKKKDY